MAREGVLSWAERAGPPSPPEPATPVPATRLIAPAGVTLRTSWLPNSAMKTFPVESMSTPAGCDSSADAAGPPFPELPATPVPASVVIVPPGVTLRTR